MNTRKLYKVFIFNRNAYPRDQEKMSKLYMNRFAIEEDEQFEIHVKNVNSHYRTKYHKGIYHTVKEVMLKAQQGSGDCHLNTNI